MTQDFYDLLDIPPDASQEDIKEAFREQVRVYHPDLNDDSRAQAQFTALKKAYDILGDPVERRAYDRLGHRDYVGKRTKGLPSPDVWKHATDESGSADSSDSDISRTSETDGSTTTESDEHRNRTAGSTQPGSDTDETVKGGTARSGTRHQRSATAGTTNEANTTSTRNTTNSGDRMNQSNTASTAGASYEASSTDGGTTTTGHAGRSNRSPTQEPGKRESRLWNNPVARWWHTQNLAMPLLWLSLLVYSSGLGQYGIANEEGIRTLSHQLAGAGANPAAILDVLIVERYGISLVGDFLAGVSIVPLQLPPLLWYGMLAGIVIGTIGLLLGIRLFWRRDTRGRVTITEIIVGSIALGSVTVLEGGPLLAGIVLMPLLYGVIIYRTRCLPGWSPSYIYVGGVTAPAIALVFDRLYDVLVIDALAFVVLPLLCALGLPVRISLRKRYGF